MNAPRRLAALAAATVAATGLAYTPVAASSALASAPAASHVVAGSSGTSTDTSASDAAKHKKHKHPKPPKPPYPPRKGHHAEVTPDHAKHGSNTTITVVADGFQPGETVDFTIDPSHQDLGTAVADSTGTATLTIPLPSNLKKGDYEIHARGTQTKVNDTAHLKLSAFASAATSSNDTSDAALALGVAALGMVGVGGGSFWTIRRRRRALDR